MTPIETYLRQLARHLPRYKHAEILPEMRSHLLELAADWQMRGLSPVEAQTRAVAQFGQARTIARQLRDAHGIVGWGDVVLAALPILGITGLGWHFIGHALPLWWYLLAFGWGTLFAWRRNWPIWWYAWSGWLFLALGVVDHTSILFWILFPLAVTLVAVDAWEHATLMALPFTVPENDWLGARLLLPRQRHLARNSLFHLVDCHPGLDNQNSSPSSTGPLPGSRASNHSGAIFNRPLYFSEPGEIISRPLRQPTDAHHNANRQAPHCGPGLWPDPLSSYCLVDCRLVTPTPTSRTTRSICQLIK
jgi:hypothetical protein